MYTVQLRSDGGGVRMGTRDALRRNHAADGRTGGNHRPDNSAPRRDPEGREGRGEGDRGSDALPENGPGLHHHQEGHSIRRIALHSVIPTRPTGKWCPEPDNSSLLSSVSACPTAQVPLFFQTVISRAALQFAFLNESSEVPSIWKERQYQTE